MPGVLLAVAATTFSCAELGAAEETLQDRYAGIATNACQVFQMMHVSQRAPDDEISRRAFTNLLDVCDSQHMVFCAEDIAEFSKSMDSLDDMIMKGDFSFAFRVRDVYGRRLAERVCFATNMIAGANFRFDGKTYSLDRGNAPWPKAGREQDDLWSLRIANEVLDRMVACETNTLPIAAEAVVQSYRDLLETESRKGPEAPYESFIAAVISAYDAHSMYLNPSEFTMFSSQMSLSMCGIGAAWKVKDGTMKVVKVLPGGPLAKDGRIRAGDKIVAVASKGTNEMVRVAGLKEAEVVSLFQGKKGEPVKLEVEHASGKSGIYTIVRDEISMEDMAASSKVIDVEIDGRKCSLGYLRLPTFYASAPSKGNGFRSSSEDVRTELKKLKKASVCGVAFDLRDNNGGSLDDAVKILGQFVRSGPGVRMRGKAGEVTLPVLDDTVECDVPVVVLVTHGSASAGELVPATLQDYGRAVIVGDEHTFGKGSDQIVASMDAMNPATGLLNPEKDHEKLGALVITEGRFYRITGGSTQLRGVSSDITLQAIRHFDEGEGDLKYPLPWDTISSAPFEKSWDLDKFIPELRAASEARRAKSATWKRHMEHVRKSVDLVSRKAVVLDYATRKKQSAADEKTYDELERINQNGYNPDKRSEDAVLDEGLNILADLVRLNGGRKLPVSNKSKEPVSGVFDSLDDDD